VLPIDLAAWLSRIRNNSNQGALTEGLIENKMLGERGIDPHLTSISGAKQPHRPCSMAKSDKVIAIWEPLS